MADNKIAASDEQRAALASAYNAVRGRELARSFTSRTFEELLDLQLSRLEGGGAGSRPSMKERIDKVVNDLVAVIEKIKSMPDDAFNDKDDDKAVNTPK